MGADEVIKEGIMVSPRLLEDHYTTTLLVISSPAFATFLCTLTDGRFSGVAEISVWTPGAPSDIKFRGINYF